MNERPSENLTDHSQIRAREYKILHELVVSQGDRNLDAFLLGVSSIAGVVYFPAFRDAFVDDIANSGHVDFKRLGIIAIGTLSWGYLLKRFVQSNKTVNEMREQLRDIREERALAERQKEAAYRAL